MKIVLEVPDNKADFAMEFLKNISFVKKAKRLAANEITNPALLKNIEDYEKGKTTPTPLSLTELKAMIHA